MTSTTSAASLLEGFTTYRVSKINNLEPSIIVRPTTITFNKAAMEALEFTENCKILINPETRQIAIQAAAKDDLDATKFFEHKEGLQNTVRWSSASTVTKFLSVAGMTRDQIDKTGIRFFGRAHPEAQTVIFEMAV